MGYSTALVAIEKVKPFLEKLADAKDEEEIIFETHNPRLFAYWLRQGVHAAKHHRVERFSRLLDQFELREFTGKVVATPKEIAINPYAIKMSSAPKAVARLTAREVTDLRMVVATVIEHKAEPEIEFPDCKLGEEELGKLYNFLTSYEYKIVNTSNGGLLLSKKQLENAWHPQVQ